jgi:DNA-binding NarL/FixJ family response regulator
MGASRHSTSAQPITLLVADPHACVREGLKALASAQPDMLVVGEVADGPSALATAQEVNPDVVVLEALLPGLEGAQVLARLREARPDRKVLVLTLCEHAGSMQLLLGMGASGYVLKRSPAERLVQALRAVAAGGTYLDPEIAGGVVGALTGSDGAGKPGAELSGREALVLRLIAQGYSNREIAARLKLSVKTIETYKARAMEKLELHSRVDIVRYAARRGWLAEDVPDPPFVSHGGGRTA